MFVIEMVRPCNSYHMLNVAVIREIMKSTKVANPRRNLTEMLHVLGEHTGIYENRVVSNQRQKSGVHL